MASHNPRASTSDAHDNSHNDNIPTTSNTNMSLLPAVPMPFGNLLPKITLNSDTNLLNPNKETFKMLASIDELADHFGPSCSKDFRNQLTRQPNLRMKGEKWSTYDGKTYTRRHALVPYICKIPNERKLRLASSVANTELLKRLLYEGTCPNSCDDHKRTALHTAASRGYREVVKILLVHRADPNRQDVLGNTPLHLAVCSASSYNFNMFFDMIFFQVVRILLEHGARVDIKDRSGRTPLDLAKSKLSMMRQRLGSESTMDSKKLFVEMTMLTNILLRKLKEQHSNIDFDELEKRLRNLSTQEIEVETDSILGEVANLSLN